MNASLRGMSFLSAGELLITHASCLSLGCPERTACLELDRKIRLPTAWEEDPRPTSCPVLVPPTLCSKGHGTVK